jgi:hypothetical protein
MKKSLLKSRKKSAKNVLPWKIAKIATVISQGASAIVLNTTVF